MRFFRKGAAISFIAAMLCSASVADASSAISVTTSDGANISFKNSSGSEVGKSIDEIIGDTDNTQPRKSISRVITVKSESLELIPTDIYIRVSASKKSTAEKFDIEITNSSGALIESEKTEVIDGRYARDFYLGCFNLNTVTESKLYTLIAEADDDVEISIVSDPRRSADKQSDEGVMTIKRVGDGTGQIKPGAYYMSTSKQVKITSASGEVMLFKASGTANVPEPVLLTEGDRIEYYSTLYLGSASIKYLPFRFGSMSQLSPGYYTEVSGGKIRVYDERGIPKQINRTAFLENGSAYILNYGTLREDEPEAVAEGKNIHLESGFLYTVGVEIGAGSYQGSGEGTVRVYDSAGYAKTVIKLKKENSSAEGVKSYVFRLSENETFVVEGNIDFKEVN